MSESQQHFPSQDEPRTQAAKFLARRGQIIVKQFRDIGNVCGTYAFNLNFTTLVYAIAHGGASDRTFGLRVECGDENTEYYENQFLDFDELRELLLAIKHLLNSRRKQVRKSKTTPSSNMSPATN